MKAMLEIHNINNDFLQLTTPIVVLYNRKS